MLPGAYIAVDMQSSTSAPFAQCCEVCLASHAVAPSTETPCEQIHAGCLFALKGGAYGSGLQVLETEARALAQRAGDQATQNKLLQRKLAAARLQKQQLSQQMRSLLQVCQGFVAAACLHLCGTKHQDEHPIGPMGLSQDVCDAVLAFHWSLLDSMRSACLTPAVGQCWPLYWTPCTQLF